MTTRQSTDLDALRGEAQGIHKAIAAALKATEDVVKLKLLEKAIADARRLRGKIEEAAAERHAERKQHLHKAAAQLAAIIALHEEVKLKHKADEMRDASTRAIEHISEAIAAARKHSPKSSAFN